MALWAYYYGPDPGNSGAPKDSNGALACASAGCHTGSASGGPVNNYAGFGVTATFSPSATTYTPGGPPVTITVTVTDPVNTKYGFEMSARTTTGDIQAGDFEYASNVMNIQVICSDATDIPNIFKTPGKACPTSTPLQFIEQYYVSSAFVGSSPYVFTWTPPATNVGSITFYVAGNAVDGNDLADAGDHVSTAKYTLTPAGSTTCEISGPVTVTSINSATDFGAWPNFASGSYLEIKGSNLSAPSDTRTWTAADFNGNNAPQQLDGISVSINSKSAYVYYISPTQIDVQAPDDATTGNVPITVTNCAGTSNSMSVAKTTLAAGMQAPASFLVNGTQYMVALILDSTLPLGYAFVGNASLSSPPYYYQPAKPGQSITAYGLGFGPVTPANPSGVTTTASNTLVNPVTISFGTTLATVTYQGLTPGDVGLYQFNITVPSTLANGDYPINVTVGGTPIAQKMSLTVHN